MGPLRVMKCLIKSTLRHANGLGCSNFYEKYFKSLVKALTKQFLGALINKAMKSKAVNINE